MLADAGHAPEHWTNVTDRCVTAIHIHTSIMLRRQRFNSLPEAGSFSGVIISGSNSVQLNISLHTSEHDRAADPTRPVDPPSLADMHL